MQYGRFDYLAKITAKKSNPLPFVIWMTRLDTRDAVQVPSPTSTETVVSNPLIPGLELHIPAGTVIRDSNGNNVTQITMTAIPVDQPPFPLPNRQVPVYFTVQPGGAQLLGLNVQAARGARLIYPNFENLLPGARVDFWNYDPQGKGWYVYGQGSVSQDAKQVIPDPGVVIYEFTGAMIALPSAAPSPALPSGSRSSGQPCSSGGSDLPANAPSTDGDPVDCSTGVFTESRTDLVVRDLIPLTVSRTYRSFDSQSRTFGIGASLSYDMFMVGDTQPWTYQELVLSDGSRVHFSRTSSGTSFTDAVYGTASPGAYFGATIKWNTITGNGWLMTLPNGTVMTFPNNDSSPSARCGAVTGIQDRYGNPLTMGRDSHCNLTSVTSPNGRSLTFTYDTSNRITQATDQTGRSVTYAYDSGGRLITATDPLGKSESYTYDSSNRMLTITDKRGNVALTNAYDANGRVSQQTYADSSTASFNYTVNGSGVVTQMNFTDERGAVKQVQFNSAGYPTSVTRALGRPEQQVTTFTRDPTSNLATSITDSMGRVTTYQYDANGNVKQVTYLSGTSNAATWNYTYEPHFAQLATATDPLSHTTTLGYDAAGNVNLLTDPLGNTTTFTHDGTGRVTSVTRTASGSPITWTYAYNGADLASVTDPIGRITQVFTDSQGRVASTKDPLGNLSQTTFDALDRVTQTVDPAGGSVQLTYDENGNLHTLQDPRGNVTSFTYDARNRQLSGTNAIAQAESYSYDASGNLVQVTDRKGQVRGYTYDYLGRVTSAGFGATTTAPTSYVSTVSHTWDAGSRMTQAVDSASGTISRIFDGMDRPTQEVSPQGQVNYSYYANGLQQSMTVLGKSAVNYTYDSAARLTQIAQGAATVGFSYDTADRRSSVTLPNGVQATYGYDAAGQLSGISYQNGATVLGNLTYSYDAAGRRIGAGGSLAQVNLPTAVSSAVYDAANRLITWGTTALTYDGNGNLSTLGSSTFGWNERDQLISTGDGSGSFSYDAFGRRVSRAASGTTTSYLHDGQSPVEVGNDFMLSGLGLDETYARVSASGTTSYLTDALGSTVALTDGSAAVTANLTYEPYGAAAKTGTDDTAFRFTGREDDGATNLYYYRARYYSPKLGRFISSDPIALAGGINTYAYADGDPIDYIDSDGLDPQKGERGHTRSPSGTDNPYKHYKEHPTDPNKVIYKDPQTGKKIEKPRPPDMPRLPSAKSPNGWLPPLFCPLCPYTNIIFPPSNPPLSCPDGA